MEGLNAYPQIHPAEIPVYLKSPISLWEIMLLPELAINTPTADGKSNPPECMMQL